MASTTFGGSTFHETGIEGLTLVEARRSGDERGAFYETFRQSAFREAGIDFAPVQANRSNNHPEMQVTRGLHAEPWNKYVNVPLGAVFAAIVDGRAGSPTFGQVEAFTLELGLGLYVPNGCLNSYQTLLPGTSYTYLVDAEYDHALAGKYPAAALDDPELGIKWPTDLGDTLISEKDRNNRPFSDIRKMGGFTVVSSNG